MDEIFNIWLWGKSKHKTILIELKLLITDHQKNTLHNIKQN